MEYYSALGVKTRAPETGHDKSDGAGRTGVRRRHRGVRRLDAALGPDRRRRSAMATALHGGPLRRDRKSGWTYGYSMYFERRDLNS